MSLRWTAIIGVRLMGIATVATVAIGLGQTIVLSRLLDPKDFGLMAMIWVVLGFAQAFSDVGMSNAILHKQDLTHEQLTSMYWVNVVAGLGVAIAAILFAPLLAVFYREPILVDLMPWVAVSFVLAAVGQQFQMIAQRDLRFGALASANILSAFTAALVSVFAAWMGRGVYALVLGGIGSALSRTVLLMAATGRTWWPSLHFNRANLRGVSRFGLYQIGERTANYIWSNVDYVMVGAYLGAEALGLYRVAYETVVRPLSTINPILNTVAYPLFSRKQNDNEALRRGFLEMVRLVGVLVFPLLAGLGAVAPLAVQVAFGAKWAAAAPVLQILCILGALRSLLNLVGSLIIAKGAVEKGLFWNVVLAVANTVAFWVTAPLGLTTLSWTAVCILASIMIVNWRSFYYDTIGLTARDYLKSVIPSAAISTAMATIVYLAGIFTGDFLNPGMNLSLLIVLGATVYTGLFVLLDRSYVYHLAEMLFRRGQ